MSLISGGKKILIHSSTYDLQQSYGDFAEPVRGVDWSYDSKYFLVTTPSGIVEILKPSTTSIKNVQKVRVKNCSAAVFYKNTHQYIGIGGTGGIVSVWDTKSQMIQKKFPVIDSSVTCLDISSTDAHLAAGSENGDVVLYGMSSNSKMQNFTIPNSKRKITSVHFSKISRSTLAGTNEAGCLAVWDLFKKKVPVYNAEAHHTICSDMAFSPVNVNFLLSVGYDNLLHMYDNRRSDPVCTKDAGFALTSVTMSADGIMVACAHRRGGIVAYDLRNPIDPVINIAPHTGVVSSIRYKPNADVSFVPAEPALACSIESNNISADNTRPNCDGEHYSQNDDKFFKLMTESPCSANLSDNRNRSGALNQDSFLAAIGIGNTIRSSPSYNINRVELESLIKLDNTAATSSPNVDLLSSDKNDSSKPIDPPTDVPVDFTSIKNQIEDSSKNICDALKYNTFDIIQNMRTNLMSLYLSMLKQHFAVIDRLSSMDTGNNTDIHNEIKKLRAENEILKFENEYLRNERAKYIPEKVCENKV